MDLDKLKAAFDHWRANKDTLGREIPADLRRQVVMARDYHGASNTCRLLSISVAQLRKYSAEYNSDTFVAIDANKVIDNKRQSTPCSLCLEHQGQKLTLSIASDELDKALGFFKGMMA
ncbi:MAG: hypothetical protein ACO23H_20960 [Alphaproteobacteria bacterium]